MKLSNNNHSNQITIVTKLGLRFSLSGLVWRKKAGELVLCFFLGRDAEAQVEKEQYEKILRYKSHEILLTNFMDDKEEEEITSLLSVVSVET